MTNQEALKNIGVALAHESLKLAQADHLALMQSYNVLKTLVDRDEELKKALKVEIPTPEKE